MLRQNYFGQHLLRVLSNLALAVESWNTNQWSYLRHGTEFEPFLNGFHNIINAVFLPCRSLLGEVGGAEKTRRIFERLFCQCHSCNGPMQLEHAPEELDHVLCRILRAQHPKLIDCAVLWRSIRTHIKRIQMKLEKWYAKLFQVVFHRYGRFNLSFELL